MEGAKRATQDDRSWKSIRRTQRFSYGNKVLKKKKRALSISKVTGRKSA